MRRYAVLLTPEPDGSAYNVTVSALPGCFTWGNTVEEALERAREAIALSLEGENDILFPDGDGAIVTTVVVEDQMLSPA